MIRTYPAKFQGKNVELIFRIGSIANIRLPSGEVIQVQSEEVELLSTSNSNGSQVCQECGARRTHASAMCPMSEDGEAPHRWSAPEPKYTPEDRAFFHDVMRHYEQGAAEH